jgi:hypothetical protein
MAQTGVIRWFDVRTFFCFFRCAQPWDYRVGASVTARPREFPSGCETFGDLTKLTLARNYGKISAEYGVSSEQEVLLLLRQLIATEEELDIYG